MNQFSLLYITVQNKEKYFGSEYHKNIVIVENQILYSIQITFELLFQGKDKAEKLK